MKMKVFAAALAFCLCLGVPVQANAAEAEITAASTEAETRAAGLISTYSLLGAGGTKSISITAKTAGFEEMSEIGFIDIKIQRSSDLTNWTTEKTVSNKIKEDSIAYSLDKYSVSVQGGYYYRVKLTHYAKEQTWLFPDEQSISNTSAYVWVS